MYHAARMSREPAVIVSTDKDMLQAVTNKVSVLNPTKEIMYTPEIISKEFGIDVKTIVDWRALQGDSSDNIPGVQGIGEKTATKLFQEYGTLTSIVNAALGHHPTHNMTGKIKDNILAFGFERIVKNISITALYADRVGARKAILESLEMFVPADKIRVKKYFMRNAFVSLLEGSFFNSISKLEKPRMRRKNLRIPIILSKTRKSYAS
jgi:5'-3' exonuclease